MVQLDAMGYRHEFDAEPKRNLIGLVVRDKDGLLPKQMEHYLCPRPVERVIALSANAKMERNRRYK